MTPDKDSARLSIAALEDAMKQVLQDAALLDEMWGSLESHSPFSLDTLPLRVRRQFMAAVLAGVHILAEPFDKVSFLLGLFVGCRIAGRVYEEEQT